MTATTAADPTPTALVTGSSSGIGRATAERFDRAGWRVYAAARHPEDVADLRDRGCHTPALDVTSDAAVDRVASRLDREVGRLDCLVNNAGYGQYGPLEDVPPSRVRAQFDVNLLGPHRLCRALLPLLRATDADGRSGSTTGTVVSVSSLAAHVPFPGASAYCASKAALEAHHDALRAEATPRVDVVLVEPGPVSTGFRARREAEMDALERSAAYDAVYERHRGGTTRATLFGEMTPEDVADAVLDAATATDPPARIPVGWRVGAAVTLARLLPRRWVERLIERL